MAPTSRSFPTLTPRGFPARAGRTSAEGHLGISSPSPLTFHVHTLVFIGAIKASKSALVKIVSGKLPPRTVALYVLGPRILRKASLPLYVVTLQVMAPHVVNP